MPEKQKPALFSVMAKPAGSGCNLRCDYCYYLEKQKLYAGTTPKMDHETLELFISQYIGSQDSSTVMFVWQGGEPMLLGVKYFEDILKLQQKYAQGKQISNIIQTNGTFIDTDWARFLRRNNFLVGLSIDGPQHINDRHRKTSDGKSSFASVISGLDLLHQHHVEFNTLSVVSRYSQNYPLEIYHFLKDIGSTFMQFLPAVERQATQADKNTLTLTHQLTNQASLTSWSVEPEGYGNFLIQIFDDWVKKDVGRYFVQLFDVTLANFSGQFPSLCVHSKTCGKAMAIERNGDVYACDHFVYPEFYRGNIRETQLKDIFFSEAQAAFGEAKKNTLAAQCLSCPVLFACHGDCPKHRFVPAENGSFPVSYLCKGLFKFFTHVKPAMYFMARELENHRPPSNVMKLYHH